LAFDLSTNIMSAPHAPRYSRLWIVTSDPEPHDARVLNAVMESLNERYPYRHKSDFRKISVILYTVEGAATPISKTGESQLGHPR
jgi:hypothetical protein